MKRQITVAYVTVGILDLVGMIVALFITCSIYYITDSVDPSVAIPTVLLFCCGVLLCRTPYSKRRVDGNFAFVIRIISMLFMAYLLWQTVPAAFTRGDAGERALCGFVVLIITANLYLLTSMNRWRRTAVISLA
jgi:hypothetical protein